MALHSLWVCSTGDVPSMVGSIFCICICVIRSGYNPAFSRVVSLAMDQTQDCPCTNSWTLEGTGIIKRYDVTKDRCSIPMDTTVRLGLLKFTLRATIDHHGPSIHSGHYTASINCCKKIFYCNNYTITEFGIIDSKNSSTAYVILYELIDT